MPRHRIAICFRGIPAIERLGEKIEHSGSVGSCRNCPSHIDPQTKWRHKPSFLILFFGSSPWTLTGGTVATNCPPPRIGRQRCFTSSQSAGTAARKLGTRRVGTGERERSLIRPGPVTEITSQCDTNHCVQNRKG